MCGSFRSCHLILEREICYRRSRRKVSLVLKKVLHREEMGPIHLVGDIESARDIEIAALTATCEHRALE